MSGGKDWKQRRSSKDATLARSSPHEQAGKGNRAAKLFPRGRRKPADGDQPERQGRQRQGVGSLGLELEGQDRERVGSLGLELEGQDRERVGSLGLELEGRDEHGVGRHPGLGSFGLELEGHDEIPRHGAVGSLDLELEGQEERDIDQRQGLGTLDLELEGASEDMEAGAARGEEPGATTAPGTTAAERPGGAGQPAEAESLPEGNVAAARDGAMPAGPRQDAQPGRPGTGAAVRGSTGTLEAASALPQPEAATALALPASLPAETADAIRTGVEGGEQRFHEALAAALQSIAAGVERALHDVQASGIRNAAAIDDAHGRAAAQVMQAAGAARAEIHGETAASRGRLAASRAQAMAAQDGEIAAGAGELRALGPEHDERIRTHTEAARERAVGEVDEAAGQARATGEGRARAGGASPEIAGARSRAAREVAGDTAGSIEARRGEVAGMFGGASAESSAELQGQADRAAGELLAAGPALAGAMHELYGASDQALAESASGAMAAIGEHERASLEALARARDEARAGLDRAVEDASVAMEQAGQAAMEQAGMQSRAALEAGRQQLAAECSAIAAGDAGADALSDEQGDELGAVSGDGEPSGLDEAGEPPGPERAAEIRARLEHGYAAAATDVTPMLGQVVEQLLAAGEQAAGGLDTMSAQARAAITRAAGEQSARLAAQAGALGGVQAEMLQQADGASQQQTDAVSRRAGEVREQLRGAFASSESTYGGGLDAQVASVRADVRAPLGDLGGRIGQAEGRVEERLEQSWLEQQLSDLTEMLGSAGFWAGLVTGLLLAGALVLVLSTAGIAALPLLAVAGIGAAIGAASAAVGTMVQNAVDGRPLTEGLLRNVLLGAGLGAVAPLAIAAILPAGAGMLATAGAVMLVGGGLGIVANLVNGEDWDKNLLGNLTVVGLLSAAARGAFNRGTRPDPHTAELQPGRSLGLQGFHGHDDVSLLGNRQVTYGTDGSSRPDYYRGHPGSTRPATSVDVKRYDITKRSRRSALARDVVGQAQDLATNAPGTRQRILVHTRGLRVTPAMIEETRQAILRRAAGLIRPEDLIFTSQGENILISWIAGRPQEDAPKGSAESGDRPTHKEGMSYWQ